MSVCWGQGATLETSRGLSPGDPGKRDCGEDRKHRVRSRRRRLERRPRGATPRREPGGRRRWGAPRPGTTATSPANPRAPGSFCFWGLRGEWVGEGEPPSAFNWTRGTTKDPTARASRVGGSSSGRGVWQRALPPPPPTLTVPAALTISVAQLNGLQAEVFDHLLTGAGGAVEGMIQARHLHFSNPLLTSACFVSRLSPRTVWERRAGKERGVAEEREVAWDAALKGRCWTAGLESRCQGDGSGWSSAERAALRDRDRPCARAGGGARPAGRRRGARGTWGRRHGARTRARGRSHLLARRALLCPFPAPTPRPVLPRARAPGCPRVSAPAAPRVSRRTVERTGTAGVKGGRGDACFLPSLLVRAVRRSFPSSRCQSEPG